MFYSDNLKKFGRKRIDVPQWPSSKTSKGYHFFPSPLLHITADKDIKKLETFSLKGFKYK